MFKNFEYILNTLRDLPIEYEHTIFKINLSIPKYYD